MFNKNNFTPPLFLNPCKLAVYWMVLLFLGIGFQSCEREEDGLVEIPSSLLTEDQKKAQRWLLSIAEQLAPEIAKNSFREKTYSEVDKQFDGDFNVLIRDLVKEMPVKDEIEKDLANFRNIEGNNYFPQIHIPFFEELREKQILGNKLPYVVLYYYQEDLNDELYGYKMNSKGTLEPFPTKINEKMAQENEIWVFSVNESVDNEGLIPERVDLRTQVDCQVYKFNILGRQHKESWAAGASEVSFNGRLLTYDGTHPLSNRDHELIPVGGTTDFRGRCMAKVSRRDVKRANPITPKFQIARFWNTATYPQFSAIIFEADAWPETLRIREIKLGNGDTRWHTFRSSHAEYDLRDISTNIPTENLEYEFPNQIKYEIKRTN